VDYPTKKINIPTPQVVTQRGIYLAKRLLRWST